MKKVNHSVLRVAALAVFSLAIIKAANVHAEVSDLELSPTQINYQFHPAPVIQYHPAPPPVHYNPPPVHYNPPPVHYNPPPAHYNPPPRQTFHPAPTQHFTPPNHQPVTHYRQPPVAIHGDGRIHRGVGHYVGGVWVDGPAPDVDAPPADAGPAADDPDAAAAPPQQDPSTMIWTIQNMASTDIQIEFYSQDRGHEWPGNGQAYDQASDDTSTHTYTLSCNAGEKICYGAWYKWQPQTVWGVGSNNRACTNCCSTCGNTVSPIVLNP